jgi:hypothetical protein
MDITPQFVRGAGFIYPQAVDRGGGLSRQSGGAFRNRCSVRASTYRVRPSGVRGS